MTRIDGINPLATSRLGHNPAAEGEERDGSERAGAAERAGAQDRATLSVRGRFIGQAVAAVASAPEVRAERVAALKAAIADGSYKSNARQIAARLLASGSLELD
jgi:negative regulator of flagellin synthesis FlgM